MELGNLKHCSCDDGTNSYHYIRPFILKKTWRKTGQKNNLCKIEKYTHERKDKKCLIKKLIVEKKMLLFIASKDFGKSLPSITYIFRGVRYMLCSRRDRECLLLCRVCLVAVALLGRLMRQRL